MSTADDFELSDFNPILPGPPEALFRAGSPGVIFSDALLKTVAAGIPITDWRIESTLSGDIGLTLGNRMPVSVTGVSTLEGLEEAIGQLQNPFLVFFSNLLRELSRIEDAFGDRALISNLTYFFGARQKSLHGVFIPTGAEDPTPNGLEENGVLRLPPLAPKVVGNILARMVLDKRRTPQIPRQL